MRNKIVKAKGCILTFLVLLSCILPFSVEGSGVPADEAQNFIDGIIAYKLKESGSSSAEEWIDTELTLSAGESAEWYVIALSQYGDYDFSKYCAALSGYLSENGVGSASSRLKYAFALAAAGSTENTYINEALNNSVGRHGVMSWIFGLHLLNNEYQSQEYSLSDVKEKLVSLQKSDGGWAITGSYGDTDVTAMAVQALAPHYNSDAAVTASVDKALDFLSIRQSETGDYASCGAYNAESTAQVLAALSMLGIDAETDSRFIKDGNTVFDGLSLYRLPDGSFSHKQGGASNETATVQVFCSSVSYILMKNGDSNLYILKERSSEAASGTPDNAGTDFPAEETTDNEPTDNQNPELLGEKKVGGSYKPWAILVILVASGLACLVLSVAKKGTLKNCLVVLIIAAAGVVFVLFTNFQSTEDYYGSAPDKKNAVGTVTVTIRCDTIQDRSAEHIPDDGIILDVAEFTIEEGDTAYDILKEASVLHKIHLETSGSADTVYVEGIANIYEFDFGDLSGWMFYVNGKALQVSCGEYEPVDGDKIEWLYTCNLGEDIESGL